MPTCFLSGACGRPKMERPAAPQNAQGRPKEPKGAQMGRPKTPKGAQKRPKAPKGAPGTYVFFGILGRPWALWGVSGRPWAFSGAPGRFGAPHLGRPWALNFGAPTSARQKVGCVKRVFIKTSSVDRLRRRGGVVLRRCLDVNYF